MWWRSDGTQVHANGSQHATRDYQQIPREILEQAAEIDAVEDEQFGERRGDEPAPALATRRAASGGCATRAGDSTSGAPRKLGR